MLALCLITLFVGTLFLKQFDSNNFLICTPNESLNGYINSGKWKVEMVANYQRPLTLRGPGGAERQFSIECYQLRRGKERISQYMLLSPAVGRMEALLYVIKLGSEPREIPDLKNGGRGYVGKINEMEYVLSIEPVGPVGDVVSYCYLEDGKFQAVATKMYQLYFVSEGTIYYVISENKWEKDDVLAALPLLEAGLTGGGTSEMPESPVI